MAQSRALAQSQATTRSLTAEELEVAFPNRPRNHGETFPFYFLYEHLFNPLMENRKKPGNPAMARKKLGPHGERSMNPVEKRKAIIATFISKWRNDVGNDIYPLFRLIMPDQDKERAMYGLKELTIAKLLIKLVKVDPDSQAAYNLKNWKSAGARTANSAGDFAGRCFDLLSQGRAILTNHGSLTIGKVNEMLDRLSVAQKEDQQLSIMEEFYHQMDATELMWLIRIILRQMKIGATERTFFSIWHPDAEALFNVSSSLRRVCWELADPEERLQGEEGQIALMSCFQPQLAQFQMHDFAKIVQKMRPTEEDNVFWVEEKLDGERMQLHMREDPDKSGGRAFKFWSRKAKDYTYLYGNGLYDENSSLTRFLKDAFGDEVRNLILDGEMVSWSMERNRIAEFGNLKTAALEVQKNPESMGDRPLFRVFDILYLNDTCLTKYTLRDRRAALARAVNPVNLRLEIHKYTEATTAAEIEPLLREVINSCSEGLVLKNPRSAYHLNERNDDWMKVKPEYMTEYGEAFDCLVIGAYYGSGRRGGTLSSYLCGIRVSAAMVRRGDDPQKMYSFCKVGGGFSMSDYKEVENLTQGKWKEWDPKNPPRKYIKLGGEEKGLQYERPDVWIMPEDSIVLAVKASQIGGSSQFGSGFTLRFPRFVKVRPDKDWKSAISIDEMLEMKANQDGTKGDKVIELDRARANKRRKAQGSALKTKTIAGNADGDSVPKFEAGSSTEVFTGLQIFVMTQSLKPNGKSEDKPKAAIEQLIKHHGATITQSATAVENTICIADREPVSVSGLKKKGTKSIIRPSWLFDCIRQAEIDMQLGRSPLLLPYEPRHVYFAKEGDEDLLNQGVEFVTGGIGVATDVCGDSFARDIDSIEEMRRLLEGMPPVKSEDDFDAAAFKAELADHGNALPDSTDGVFARLVVFFDREDVHDPEDELEIVLAEQRVRLGGGSVGESPQNAEVTTVVVLRDDGVRARRLREKVARRRPMPRIVTMRWVERSWEEGTALSEEDFAPLA